MTARSLLKCIPDLIRHLPPLSMRRKGQSTTCMVLIGLWMIGPRPASMSKGMFMPVSGVRMSENRMTPSGLKALQGCSETSTCSRLSNHLGNIDIAPCIVIWTTVSPNGIAASTVTLMALLGWRRRRRVLDLAIGQTPPSNLDCSTAVQHHTCWLQSVSVSQKSCCHGPAWKAMCCKLLPCLLRCCPT